MPCPANRANTPDFPILMLVGPVFTRELLLAPRRTRMYVSRASYGLALLVLMSTAWLVLTGTQLIRDVGDLARFGMTLFQILAPLQLAVVIFFSALLAASAVSQEKDRRTLDLLLLTKLSNTELVLGKLLAALLNVFVLLAVGLPVFMLAALFGGVSFAQIGRVFAVTVLSVLAGGSLGSTLALWREKTFQALALSMLILMFWLVAWRAVAMGVLGSNWGGVAAESCATVASPLEAILEASRPYTEVNPALGVFGSPVNLFLLVAVGMVVALNGLAIARVRTWNPSREAQTFRREDETWHRASIYSTEQEARAPRQPTQEELVKKRGQAPRVGMKPAVLRIGPRSQSPFFHKREPRPRWPASPLGAVPRSGDTAARGREPDSHAGGLG